jgi:hypothetical protein
VPENRLKQQPEREMPSKSAKQARLMAAAAHSPSFAKRVGVPMKVAKEFNAADKGGRLIKRAMKGRRGR